MKIENKNNHRMPLFDLIYFFRLQMIKGQMDKVYEILILSDNTINNEISIECVYTVYSINILSYVIKNIFLK